MRALIDWYTFSCGVEVSQTATKLPFHRLAKHIVDRSLPTGISALLFPHKNADGSRGWEVEKGRGPYQLSIVNPMTRVRAYLGENVPHMAVEISGIGCAHLWGQDVLLDIVKATHDRCTRIDISCDIDTDCHPQTFVSSMGALNKTSISHVQSNSGYSVYIGSPSSERRCVVYRYNHPHPRSPFLRVEHRHKGDLAKIVAWYLVRFGLTQTLHAAADPYKWQHPAWSAQGVTVEPLPKRQQLHLDSKKFHWLHTQVFPALRKYEREGDIPDLRAFLEEFLFDDHSESEG